MLLHWFPVAVLAYIVRVCILIPCCVSTSKQVYKWTDGCLRTTFMKCVPMGKCREELYVKNYMIHILLAVGILRMET